MSCAIFCVDERASVGQLDRGMLARRACFAQASALMNDPRWAVIWLV
jgi:hypothetical protein